MFFFSFGGFGPKPLFQYYFVAGGVFSKFIELKYLPKHWVKDKKACTSSENTPAHTHCLQCVSMIIHWIRC